MPEADAEGDTPWLCRPLAMTECTRLNIELYFDFGQTAHFSHVSRLLFIAFALRVPTLLTLK